MIDLNNLDNELALKKEEFNFDIPKLSIIIPAYNIEQYICDCLKSLQNQNLKEIEIIVVNDGSVDNTSKIVEIFSKYDSRIRLINQENQRVGTARNNGVKEARADFVIFIDGDDEFEEDSLSKIYKTITEQKTDIVVFGAYNFLNNKCKSGSYSIEKIPDKLKEKVLTPNIIQKNFFKFPILCMCKIYNKNFLIQNSIKFSQVRSGEDQIFYINAFLSAKSIYVINKNFYKYRRNRKNSLTYTKQKNDNAPILNLYEIEKFLNTQHISKELKFKILNKYVIKAYSWLGKCSENFKPLYYKELIDLKKFLEENYSEYYWKKIKFNEKSSYGLIKLNIFKSKLF